MKRACLILVFWLTATVIGFSQAISIDVDDEPLNRVLYGLGLEISFDDRAMSMYSISADLTFENPEKALLWLLKDKPFRFEKIGNVFVIVPVGSRQQETDITPFQETRREWFVFRGTVVSQNTGEPLEYATVSLLDNQNRPLTSGITDDNGRFTIQTLYIPSKIKISYLGYETLLREIDNLNGELGRFPLQETAIVLDDAIVTADNRRSEISRSTYTVTQQMRYGVENAMELLDKIPGAFYDRSSSTARLNYQANVLLLVDGVQQAHAYLNHLSPDRIHAIEVIYALSGRFVSDDYAGIIHFILKKDYTGYDLHASNALSLNLSKTAENNRLTEFRPSVGFIYTTRKLNFFGMYGYDRENRFLQSSKYVKFTVSELTSIPDGHPNNAFENETHTFSGGLNYHINPYQLVGIQADYKAGNTSTSQAYTMRQTDYAQNQYRTFSDVAENEISAYAFTGALFYQGQVSNRLRLFGDFSYNYYYNDMKNEYCQDITSGYRDVDLWNEFKDQTNLNTEAKYNLSDRLTAEAGYANIWRQYASKSIQGKGFLDYSEHRNKAFVYLTWYFSKKGGLKSGVAIEHIRQRSQDIETGYLRTLPFLRVDYTFNRKASVAVGYATGQTYPSLFQLSPIPIVIDTFLTHISNPTLKSAVRRQVFAELTLWNRLKIMPQFNYISDGVSEVYDRLEYRLYRLFDNVNYREYSLHASYDQLIGTNFRLKNTVMFYHNEALHNGIRSALNGWIFHFEADYYHRRSSSGIQAGYYRNMRMNMRWQGYQMSEKDYWCLTARKELWNNRISLALSYIPPLDFGVRHDRLNEMNTPLYTEKTAMNLRSYNQMLLLKVSIRFERGGVKPAETRTDRKVNER